MNVKKLILAFSIVGNVACNFEENSSNRLLPSSEASLISIEFRQDGKAINYKINNNSNLVLTKANINCYVKSEDQNPGAVTFEDLLQWGKLDKDNKQPEKQGIVIKITPDAAFIFEKKLIPKEIFEGYHELDNSNIIDKCFVADARGRERRLLDVF